MGAALVSGSLQSVRYKVSEDLATHADAVASCLNQGGKLLEPKSNDDRVQQNPDDYPNYSLDINSAWIGIETKDGKTWTYTSGASLTQWALQNVDEDLAYYNHDYDSDGDMTKCATQYLANNVILILKFFDCKDKKRYI